MKTAGIVLVVLQIIMIFTSISSGDYSLFQKIGHSSYEVYAYITENLAFHIVGIVGVILLIVARRRKIKANAKIKQDEDD